MTLAGPGLSRSFPKNRVECVPDEIFGIATARFDHNDSPPSSKEQPVFTVWAVLNAMKNCSNKLLPVAIQPVRKAMYLSLSLTDVYLVLERAHLA